MTSQEYRDACDALGLSYSAAGRFLGVTSECGRAWATNREPTPAAAKLLRLMVAMKLDSITVDCLVNE